MSNSKQVIQVNLGSKQKGLTTVEYAVAGGLIAGVLVLAFTDLGATVLGIIRGINTALLG